MYVFMTANVKTGGLISAVPVTAKEATKIMVNLHISRLARYGDTVVVETNGVFRYFFDRLS